MGKGNKLTSFKSKITSAADVPKKTKAIKKTHKEEKSKSD